MTDRVINESSKRITCGYNGYPGHKGVDLGWRQDENQNKVYANCKGTVVEIQDGLDRVPGSSGVKSWGNYVLIKHPNGMYSRYCHMKKGLLVKKDQEVDENTQLGIIGDSGNTTARHHHFEVQTGYSSDTRIDPTPYLTKAIYVELDPQPQPKPEPTPAPSTDFKVGDKVIVSGYATADSLGGGSRTAEYNGTTDTLYITKITDLSKPRPYHISRGATLGNQDRGWVAKSQIKKA